MLSLACFFKNFKFQFIVPITYARRERCPQRSETI